MSDAKINEARAHMLLSLLRDPSRTTPPPNALRCRELAAEMRAALRGTPGEAARALEHAEQAFDDLARVLELIGGLCS